MGVGRSGNWKDYSKLIAQFELVRRPRCIHTVNPPIADNEARVCGYYY